MQSTIRRTFLVDYLKYSGISFNKHMRYHTSRRTDRQTDRQTGRQAGRQAGRQTDRQTKHADKQDRQNSKRQTDRRTSLQIHDEYVNLKHDESLHLFELELQMNF